MIIVYFVLGVASSVLYAAAMLLWATHGQRGNGGNWRARRSVDDPHQHCDRHPIRCSHARTIDRYRDALGLVAKCPNCHGCVVLAKAALADAYQPD